MKISLFTILSLVLFLGMPPLYAAVEVGPDERPTATTPHAAPKKDPAGTPAKDDEGAKKGEEKAAKKKATGKEVAAGVATDAGKAIGAMLIERAKGRFVGSDDDDKDKKGKQTAVKGSGEEDDPLRQNVRDVGKVAGIAIVEAALLALDVPTAGAAAVLHPVGAVLGAAVGDFVFDKGYTAAIAASDAAFDYYESGKAKEHAEIAFDYAKKGAAVAVDYGKRATSWVGSKVRGWF